MNYKLILRNSFILGICILGITLLCIKVFKANKPVDPVVLDQLAKPPTIGKQFTQSEIDAVDEREAKSLGVSVERLRQVRKKAAQLNQEMIDAGMIVGTPYTGNARLLGANGKVTDNALAAAGIDNSEKEKVQAKIDQLWTDMSSGMSASVRPNDKKTNAEKGVYVFNMPANAELGAKLLSSFKADLTQKYGESSAKILAGGLQTMQHFGNFGKLDVEIKFQTNKQGGKLGYEYTGVDPKSGKAVIGGSSGIDRIHETFGDIFDVSGYE